MNTITNLKIAAAGVLLAVAASACGSAIASTSDTEEPRISQQTPDSPQGHIEPPRVVDGLDLTRQVIVE